MGTALQITDNRPAAVIQCMQNKAINNSPVTQLHNSNQTIANHYTSRQQPIKIGENTTGLPDQLKSGIENLAGMSLNDVKVHRNSNKPAQLQAHAYTQGTNIHLAPGQEKHLGHEAWHVVQQKQGRVKPLRKLQGMSINDDAGLEAEADLMSVRATQAQGTQAIAASEAHAATLKPVKQLLNAQGPIQRIEKNIIITGLSHLVERVDKTIYGGKQKQEIIHGQELVIESDSMKKSRRGPNQEDFSKEDKTGPQHYVWFKVISIDGKPAEKHLYVREDVFVLARQQGKKHALDSIVEVVESVTNVPATLIGNEGISGVADALNDKTVKTNTSGGSKTTASGKKHAANMGIVGDSITGITGILGLAKGFKDLGDPEAKAADLFETAMNIEQGAMKTGEAVSKLAHTASKSSNPTTASKFGSTFEGYGAAFSGIKNGFTAMQNVVTLIKKHQEYDSEEKAQKAAKIGISSLKSARDIVLSVKSFIELVNGAASGGLMAAVPGLDIAISAGNLIMDGYYLAISNSSRKVMNDRRKQLKSDHGNNGDLNEASEFYRTTDAEIENRKQVIEDDQKRLEKENSSSEKKRLNARIKKLKKEILHLEDQKSEENISREDVAEYTMATEFRDANTKRVIRQIIHISTEMTKIAGSIAILTGVGAMGGAITKGAATAVELSLPAARLAKQAGRNRAARKISKGKQDSSKFDHTKSTAAKHMFRVKQVKQLIRLIINISYKNPIKSKNEYDTVKNYLDATGVRASKLFKMNGDPQTQIAMLVDAIQKREFMD